ncbi:hypothetical protein [Roseateles sp. P5_D6]
MPTTLAQSQHASMLREAARRNGLHALLESTEVNEAAAIWVVLSLLVLGLWQKRAALDASDMVVSKRDWSGHAH